MSFYRSTEVRATMTKCSIQAGKAVVQFEIGGDQLYTLPTLALLTGERVNLRIESDQSVLLLDEGTGEIIDQEPCEDQMTIDEAEEGEADEVAEADDTDGPELPPAAQEYEPDDELDAIFGAESAA